MSELLKISGRYRTGIFCLLLVVWQLAFYLFSSGIPKEYARKDATGLAYYYAKKFFYFYHHLGYFPLISEKDPAVSSKEEAESIINHGGQNLQMEYNHWSRLGDSGRLFLFLPDAWLFNKVIEPEVKTFHAIFFISSLLWVFLCFSRIQQQTLGFLYVLLIGSSPFWLYEVYVNRNLFPILIINFNFLLGIFCRPIFNLRDDKLIYKILLAGICIGFFAGMRSEVKSMALGCLLVIVLHPYTGILKKAGMVLLLLATVYGMGKLIDTYFEKKFDESYQLVQQHGGIPYTGKRIHTHKFWHPVFVFLGDFDTRYGYGPRVNDTVAYRYAIPILKKKYGIDVKYSGKLFLDEYYDSTHKYYKKFDEIPEYETICKDKVIHDISHDPFWYAGILAKRFIYNIAVLSPIGLSVAGLYLHIDLSGIPILLMLAFLLYKKQYTYLRLLAFSLPISLASFVIYAKDNITYNHVYHILAICILLSLAYKRNRENTSFHPTTKREI